MVRRLPRVIVNWFPSAHIQRQLDAIGRVSQSRRGNLPGARSEFVKVCYNSLRASSSPVTKKIGRPTSKRPSRAPPANPVIAYGRLATGAVERCITSENWRSNSVVCHALGERTNMGSGAPRISSDDLTRERLAHGVEIHMPGHRIYIACTNRTHQHG